MSALQTAPTGTIRGAVTEDPPESFEQFYAQTRDQLYAYVMGMLRDRDAAEDVTAQTFERVYRTWRKVDRQRGGARTWLFGIARNAAIDELRRLRKQAIPTEPTTMERIGGSEDGGDAGDVRIALQQAIATLKTRDRELIALKYYAGLNNREIAAVTRESESNVGTRLSRIVRTLRSTL